MKIELDLVRSHAAVDESIELRVVLTNNGDRAVRVPDPLHTDNWQPTYTIEGPAWPSGHRFSARSALTPDARPAPDDVPLVMAELAPGATHEGELPLWQWCRLSAPGHYSITASIEHDGVSVRSPPVELELRPLAARGVSVGLDVATGPTAPGQLWMSFVHAAGSSSRLYDSMWIEDRPDLGELSMHSLDRRRDLSADVDAVHVPWSTVDRMMAMTSWRVWRQGTRLVVDDSPLAEPFGLTVEPSARILPPAWQDPREDLHVLLAVDGGHRLEATRFSGGAAPHPPRGRVEWSSEEQPRVSLARLALGPPSEGSQRRVASAWTEDGNLSIAHFVVADGTSGKPTSVAKFKNATLLPGTPLALRVTAAGHTQVWVLAATGAPGRWQIYLGAVEFDNRGRHGGGTIQPLVTLPCNVVDTTIELPFAGPDLERPVWAILTDRGQVLWARGDTLRWHTIARHEAEPPTRQPIMLGQATYLGGRRPVSPMQLRPLAEACYLAVFDPGRAPRFITLEG